MLDCENLALKNTYLKGVFKNYVDICWRGGGKMQTETYDDVFCERPPN